MKIKNVIIISVVLVVLALVKIFFLSPKQNKPGGKTAGAPPVALIRAAIVKRAELDNIITSSGSIMANEEVTLNPEMAGKIISRNEASASIALSG